MQRRPVPIKSLLTRRDLIVFLISVVLFHFGNAAMLPMAGQVLAQTHPGSDTIALSACIIAAQLVMVAIAWAVGKAMSAGYGRKTIFLVALAVLPVRGLLFSFTSNPFGVVAIQLLDGVAAGIFGVIAIVIAADLTRGTGRFNLAQGLVALCIGVGAGLSNLVAGYIVQAFGYPVGFLALAVFAAGALAFFAIAMPETRDMRGEATARRGYGGEGERLNLATLATAAIVALGTAGVIIRPWGLPEAVWAVAGAIALVALGLLPIGAAWTGIAKGLDVYLFLTGMMLIAELARREGLFDWLAGIAASHARGSARRLFALVYVVGILVTVFLSNDATAVVLTPAVYAVARAARAEPLPYLFVCAFIANAASFVLPISNPANLVVFGSHMPPLLQWLVRFGPPSLVSIAVTYVVLRWSQRAHLKEPTEANPHVPSLGTRRRHRRHRADPFGDLAARRLGARPRPRPADLHRRDGDAHRRHGVSRFRHDCRREAYFLGRAAARCRAVRLCRSARSHRVAVAVERGPAQRLAGSAGTYGVGRRADHRLRQQHRQQSSRRAPVRRGDPDGFSRRRGSPTRS